MKLLACSFAVFAAVLLTYLPSVRYEFVSYDDYEYAYQNPNVLGGLSRENLAWAVKSCGYASNWHLREAPGRRRTAAVAKVK